MDLGQDVPFWSLILPWGVWSLCFVDNFSVLSAGLFSQLLWGWGRDAGSSVPTTGIKKNWPSTSQEISDYSQRYTERHRDAGLNTQWEDDFPFCPLVHKLKMSPCMLSHLLRDPSFLSCTNPPQTLPGVISPSICTKPLCTGSPGLPCTSPECIPSSSVQRKTWICACLCSLGQH